MRLSRSLCIGFVTVLCSLCAVQSASAAKAPTVAQELKRLAAEGALTPEDAAAHRALYIDARSKVKRLTGARKTELGGVVYDLEGMAARGSFNQPSRIPALFLTLRRNVEYWSSQPLLRSGARMSFPGSELVFQYYLGHGLQIQWLGTFGKLNGYWSGGKRYDARAGALLDEALPLATERAGGLAWEYLFPFDGQNPPWVSSLAQGTGLQAMARTATRLQRQAEVFPIALRGLGIFQTAPPAGVRVESGNGAHYLQYSGLARFFVLNGFIQSLVGLYDFAQLTGDATARALFDAGDLAAQAGGPDLRHRRLVAVLARVDQEGVRPRLPQAPARLPRPALQAHRGRAVLQRQPALHRVPDDPAGRRGPAAHAAAQEVRQAALQALEDLARSACGSRRGRRRSR